MASTRSPRSGLHDSLVVQLRRICAHAGVESSISDGPAELRSKLRAFGPHEFARLLHDSTYMRRPAAPHESSVRPSTPEDDEDDARVDMLEQVLHLQSAVEDPTAKPPEPAPPPWFHPTPHYPWEAPSVPPPSVPSDSKYTHTLSARPPPVATPSSPAQMLDPRPPPPRVTAAKLTARVHVADSDRQSTPLAVMIRDRKTQEWGDSKSSASETSESDDDSESDAVAKSPRKAAPEPKQKRGRPSAAATYLLESDPGVTQTPMVHSLVLSRVVASAERLEQAFCDAIRDAPGDEMRATEGARLSTLRAHIVALGQASQQAYAMQKRSEEQARQLAKKNESLETALFTQKHECAQLKVKLARRHLVDAKEKVTIAMLYERNKNVLDAESAVKLKEAAIQKQLEEANNLTDDVSMQLVRERQRNATAMVEAKSAEGVARMEAENAEEDGRRTVAMLERKVARLQEDANRYARESIMKKWQHAKRNVGEHEGPAVSIPPGGSVGPGGVIYDRDGKPVLGDDGQPLTLPLPDPRVPPGGTIGRGGILLDAFGRPVLGASGRLQYLDPRIPPGGSVSATGEFLDKDGKPLTPSIRIRDPRIPPGGSVGRGGLILGADGKPVLGSDGHAIYTDPRIPSGGSVGASGQILDARGKPLIGANGRPLYADPRVPTGGSIDENGMIIDSEGHPVLDSDGQPLRADPLLTKVPPGGTVSANGMVLDASGKPLLGSDGRPVYADARIPPGGTVSESGIILDANGQPVLSADGKLMNVDPRIPPGGSVGANGVVLDADGEPVLGDDGLPVFADARIPPGGTVSENGIILDGNGQPVVGADGKPVYADPRVPPGGSVGEDGVIRDAVGNPLIGDDGLPLVVSRIPPGGSVSESGIILDANGRPVLGADGKPAYADPRVPPGGSVGEDGVIRDAGGNPLIGDDGLPLVASMAGSANIFASKPTNSKGNGGAGGRRRVRNSEVTPAGRLVLISRMRAKDVPDVDLRGGENNISDPYLVFALLGDKDKGDIVDEARTPHIENSRNPRWKETLRLFAPDEDAPAKTKAVRVRISIWDNNNKRADVFIGDVDVKLPVGAGRIRIEVPSRCPSPLRPFIFFNYTVLPQMFFEQVEFSRVKADLEEAPPDPEDDDGDEPAAAAAAAATVAMSSRASKHVRSLA